MMVHIKVILLSIISLKINIFKKAIILGIIFGIFMSFELFYPNQYMPLIIRMIHFPELMISNFIWGLLIVLFLDKKEKNPVNILKY